ncbi:hypothetical protein BD413DRAFT_524578 [Trametes elegans]|nr:hypothetical protein BD413DRAFT_524578 [Trametes elegans]
MPRKHRKQNKAGHASTSRLVDSDAPRGGSFAGGSPHQTVLIISLEKDSWVDEMYAQLYQALRKNATVHEISDARAAASVLSSNTPPFSVLVSDAGIASSKHVPLLNRLVRYARAGGRVVLGMQLGNYLRLDTASSFFRAWGLDWDAGSYFRTTFALNPAGLPPPLSATALFPSLSMKALHVKNAPRECAVYLPTAQSRLESLVYAPTPISGDMAAESPAVFTRVGEGYLGYVGDVNAEQGSIRLLIEMCGVAIQPGDLGAAISTTRVGIHSDLRTEAVTEREEEIPLPTVRSQPALVSAETEGTTPSPAVSPVRPRVPPRPREADVVARATRREQVRQDKLRRAEALKEEGNACFKREWWEVAADHYYAAALVAGPRPVYMANFAAAMLKLELWDVAESAATRALIHEPTHIKALFRRAIARKEMCQFTGAETDLRRILEKDPENAAARDELNTIRTLRRRMRSADLPGDDPSDDVVEFEEESDSEDYNHVGNGTPCKFHNHGGCAHGTRCRFRHTPDGKSVRDELGRNVCVYWLFGECRFGDERCVYAHDKTYLPDHGWWTDTQRTARLRGVVRDVLNQHQPWAPKTLPAHALKPDPWRGDHWAVMWGDGDDEDGYDDNEWSEDDGGEGRLWREIEERSLYAGHTRDDFEELLSQGIKPWDEFVSCCEIFVRPWTLTTCL